MNTTAACNNCSGNFFEWQLSHELLSKENHPGHPEKEDVMASLQKSAWIERFQVSGLVNNHTLLKVPTSSQILLFK
jgi:hypothetical protein